jgi:hypothetical protein
MNANSAFKINAKSYGRDYVRESDTMDAPQSPTSTSGPIVAESTIITTNSRTLAEQRLTDGYENVSAKRDIFSSRGHTGWE